MRNPEDFVREYRKRGYSDARIRVIANLTREPLRGEVLALLDKGLPIETQSQGPAGERPKLSSGGDTDAAAVGPEQEAAPASVPQGRRRTTAAKARAPGGAARPTQAPDEKTSPEEVLEKPRPRLLELERVDERISAMTQQLEQARREVNQARESEAERQSALELAQKERAEALQRADEFSEQMAQHEATVANLQQKIAQQEHQVVEARNRAEQDVARIRKELEQESRHFHRRATTYRKLAVTGAIAAGILLIVALLPLGSHEAGKEKPKTLDEIASLNALPDSTISDASGAAAGATAGSAASSPAQTTRSQQAGKSDNILTGVTTSGAEEAKERAATEKAAGAGVKGVAPMASKGATTATSAVAAGGRTIIYTVKQGDNLWNICKEQLGDANLANKVAQENRIPDPRRLKVGKQLKLTVPEKAAETKPAPAAAVKSRAKSA